MPKIVSMFLDGYISEFKHLSIFALWIFAACSTSNSNRIPAGNHAVETFSNTSSCSSLFTKVLRGADYLPPLGMSPSEWIDDYLSAIYQNGLGSYEDRIPPVDLVTRTSSSKANGWEDASQFYRDNSWIFPQNAIGKQMQEEAWRLYSQAKKNSSLGSSTIYRDIHNLSEPLVVGREFKKNERLTEWVMDGDYAGNLDQLNSRAWTPTMNDFFIKGLIDANRPVQFRAYDVEAQAWSGNGFDSWSPGKFIPVSLDSTAKNGKKIPSVTHRELLQFEAAGWSFFDLYILPPGWRVSVIRKNVSDLERAYAGANIYEIQLLSPDGRVLRHHRDHMPYFDEMPRSEKEMSIKLQQKVPASLSRDLYL